MKEEKSTKLAVIDSNTGIDKYGQSWKDRVLSHPERTIRVGTAFSGIGAPEMALSQLGIKHEIIFACDINKSAKKSYLANYDVKDWWDDVKELDATRYRGMIDLFVAGVCCQPWSLAGKLKGLDDERGQLFYQFVRVICECAPKVWIFENVDNILHHKSKVDGKEVLTWSILLNDMETKFKEAGLNYHLHYRVLDAADYGVPQHRERVFCIGFLDEGDDGKDDFLFPAPIKLEKAVYDYLDDLTPGVRKLTTRERISLMGFPKTFKQVVSDPQLSKQSGNSIVVDVLMALYKQMDITKYGMQHKFNNLIINKMKQKMNYEGMSYNELVAQKMELEKAINKMREQEMKRAFIDLLKTYSISKEEMMRIYFGEDSTISIPAVENTPNTGEETPMEETVSITPESQEGNKVDDLWNHPALKAPYTSKAGKKNEVAPVDGPETELPTMESLLSDVPEYKELYTPKVLMKKSKKSLPTMDELLSDDPTNRILCLGNEKEKGSPYRQHTRINHADGIIPTETATGQTMVYIPPRPTMKA